MDLQARLKQLTPGIMTAFTEGGHCLAGRHVRKGFAMSGQLAVQDALRELVALMFPGCHMRRGMPTGAFEDYFPGALERTALTLRDLCREAFEYQCLVTDCTAEACHTCDANAEQAAGDLVAALPAILKVLQQDIVAAYEGDPAAKSRMEVVMSYPGVFATIVHRIAHQLHTSGVPLIPRVMSELAHSQTGIDIHPGATIGEGFFIDHGTGVVIGETCAIGKYVKLYQGVTLGALSFEKDEQGRLVKGIKRHPDVEDHVVIYAGATILGGRTLIGAHSEVGGNVWLTHSVPPYSKVYNRQPKPLIREKDGSWRTIDGPWNDLGAGI
jgi:serine O-acetyltransferase